MRIKSHHLVAREQPRGLAPAVADAAMTSSAADSPASKEMHRGQDPATRRRCTFHSWRHRRSLGGSARVRNCVPHLLRGRRALRGGDRVAQGRLEHAIARALLDAWTHGLCSAEAVGSAYALVGDRVAWSSGATEGEPPVRGRRRNTATIQRVVMFLKA